MKVALAAVVAIAMVAAEGISQIYTRAHTHIYMYVLISIMRNYINQAYNL